MSPERWGLVTFGMVFIVLMVVLWILRFNNIIDNLNVIFLFTLVSLVIAVVVAANVSARIRDYQDGSSRR